MDARQVTVAILTLRCCIESTGQVLPAHRARERERGNELEVCPISHVHDCVARERRVYHRVLTR